MAERFFRERRFLPGPEPGRGGNAEVAEQRREQRTGRKREEDRVGI
jgi:hypothetical protein